MDGSAVGELVSALKIGSMSQLLSINLLHHRDYIKPAKLKELIDVAAERNISLCGPASLDKLQNTVLKAYIRADEDPAGGRYDVSDRRERALIKTVFKEAPDLISTEVPVTDALVDQAVTTITPQMHRLMTRALDAAAASETESLDEQ
eukprot:4484206-Prymnesium_polylepis.1